MGGVLVCCSEKFIKRELNKQQDDEFDLKKSNVKGIKLKKKGKRKLNPIEKEDEFLIEIEKENLKKKLLKNNSKNVRNFNISEVNLDRSNFETFAKFNELEPNKTTGEEDFSRYLNENYPDTKLHIEQSYYEKEKLAKGGSPVKRLKIMKETEHNNSIGEIDLINNNQEIDRNQAKMKIKKDPEEAKQTKLSIKNYKKPERDNNDFSNDNEKIENNRDNSSLRKDLELLEDGCKTSPEKRSRIEKEKAGNDPKIGLLSSGIENKIQRDLLEDEEKSRPKIEKSNYFKIEKGNIEGKEEIIEKNKEMTEYITEQKNNNKKNLNYDNIKNKRNRKEINDDTENNKKDEEKTNNFNKSSYEDIKHDNENLDKNKEEKNNISRSGTKLEKSDKKNYFVRLYIDSFMIKKTYINEYGLIFKPKVLIRISEKESITFNLDENDNNNSFMRNSNNYYFSEEEFSISNYSKDYSDNNLKFGLNNKNPKSQDRAIFKQFNFKQSKSFDISKYESCESIKIFLINDIYEGNKLPVIIGENQILFKSLKKNFDFDGFINLIIHEEKTIGFLKLKIDVSDKKFSDNENFQKYTSEKILNDEEGQEIIYNNISRSKSQTINPNKSQAHNNSYNMNNSIIQDLSCSIYDINNKIFRNFKPVYQNEIIHYSDFNDKKLKEFFFIIQDDKEKPLDIKTFLEDNKKKLREMVKISDNLMKINDDLNEKKKVSFNLEKEFTDIILKDHSIHLYEFLNILIMITQKDDLTIINKFFQSMTEDAVIFFYNIPLLFSENIFIIRSYFLFILKYRTAVKNSLDLIFRNEYALDDMSIISSIFEYFIILYDELKADDMASITINYSDNNDVISEKNKNEENRKNNKKTKVKYDKDKHYQTKQKLKNEKTNSKKIKNSLLTNDVIKDIFMIGVNLLSNFITFPAELLSFAEDLKINQIEKKSEQNILNNEEIEFYNQEIFDQNHFEQNLVYNNSIDIISNFFLLMRVIDLQVLNNDTVFLNSIIRLFRKNVQILTNDYIKIIEFRENLINLKQFSKSFKHTLITMNDNCFLLFLRIMIKKLGYYPDFFNNILIILNQLSCNANIKNLIQIATEINLEELKSVFDIYRNRFSSNFYRTINTNYLNLLANLTEISDFGKEENLRFVTNEKIDKKTEEKIMKESENNKLIWKKIEEIFFFINMDMKLFFYLGENSKKKNDKNSNGLLLKKYESFKEKKKLYIELHEIITRIGNNLTSNIEYTISLFQSNFYIDVIDFLIFITKGENVFEKIVIFNKKKNADDIKSLFTSIVENSIYILFNAMNCSFVDKKFSLNKALAQNKIADEIELFLVVEQSIEFLEKNNCSIKKAVENYEVLVSLFEHK